MLAEKNGLRSVRRSPVKSILLFFLMLFLTAVLSLGVCIYTAIGTYLQQCDDYYHTVATLEYMGASYPATSVYDPVLEEQLTTGAVNPDAMAALPGVMRYEANQSALGVIEGLNRADRLVYDADAAVLVVSDLVWDDNVCAYMGRIRECLYSRVNNTGKVVFLNSYWSVDPADPGVFETDETYIFSGRYIRGTNSYLHFEPKETGSLSERETYAAEAMRMAYRNNGLRVQMTGDLASYLPFQRAELTLTAGRLFTEEEYTAGARVCVISDRIADYLGVSVGETVPLSLNYPTGGLFNVTTTAIAPVEEYTVVGIYGETQRYPDWAFVPERADYTPAKIPTGYTVGQFRLENEMADAFYQEATKDLPTGFRLTVYDQGYAVTAAPYRELLRMARIFLFVCLLVSAAVLALFGYLFVTRQKETADTMLALGSGKGHVYRYFVAGGLAIALPATIAGVLLSRGLEQQALQLLASFAGRYQAQDLRYSITVLGQVRTLAFQPSTPWWLYGLAALCMLLAVGGICLLFAALAMVKKRQKKKKRTVTPRKTARSSRLSGWFKYGWLSIRRGRMRTASVVALAMVAAAFLGQLTSTTHAYEEQMREVRANTTITGYRANIDGLSMDGLTVGAESVQTLYDSGLLDKLDVSRRVSNYRFVGVRRNAAGELQPLEEPQIPTNSFALETFLEQLEREPLWMATTSLRNAPDFYYAAAPEVTWLAGYDESCLFGTEAALCVLPNTLMEREGIELGSVIRVLARIRDSGPELRTVDLLVVGSYLPQDTKETMYTPFDYAFPVGATRKETALSVENAQFPLTGEWNGYSAAMLSEDSEKGQHFIVEVDGGQRGCELFRKGSTYSSLITPNTRVCVISWILYGAIQENPESFPGLSIDGRVMFLTIPDNTGTAYTYRVIGAFDAMEGDTVDIYCSPSNRLMEQEWEGYLDKDTPLSRLTWNSAVFTLKEAARLNDLRDALEAGGFAATNQFGVQREYIILDDKDYISTVNGLERQIRYVSVLNTVLYVLTGLIAFAAAFLLLNSRKGEVAIMRGLGTPPRRIFAVFLAEQMALCLIGCAVGLGVWFLAGGHISTLCGILTGAFLLCWAAGTAVTACRLLRSKALAALSDRE